MVIDEFKKKDEIIKMHNEIYEKDRRHRMISNM